MTKRGDEDSRFRQRGTWWPLAILLIAIALLEMGLHLGQWLVVDEPLEKADAILVFSGGLPGRALEAARVYKQGYAPQVWLTYSTEPGATMAKYHVEYTGEEIYDTRLLMQQGVPDSAIRVLDRPIVNTADEVRAAGIALRQGRLHKIILVTSKVHTRRVRLIWKRLVGKEGLAIVHGVSDDGFEPERWWKTTRDALDVVREVLGLLNAWAGFPLWPTG